MKIEGMEFLIFKYLQFKLGHLSINAAITLDLHYLSVPACKFFTPNNN